MGDCVNQLGNSCLKHKNDHKNRTTRLSEHTLLSTGGKSSETGKSLLLQSYSISGETRSRQNEQNHSPLRRDVRTGELLGQMHKKANYC